MYVWRVLAVADPGLTSMGPLCSLHVELAGEGGGGISAFMSAERLLGLAAAEEQLSFPSGLAESLEEKTRADVRS